MKIFDKKNYKTTTIMNFHYKKLQKDFKIKKQIACHFVQYSECLSNPLPSMQLEGLTCFVIQGSQQIMIKRRDFSQL